MKASSLISSFRFAFAGIAHAFKTQRNFKVHCGVSVLVLGMGLALQIDLSEWAIIAIAAGLVFQAELVNTALEALVDKVSPERHPLAKVTKDCAAGAVLVTALAAVLVGLLVFGPKLLVLL
jgi:diacylglycerol kinase